MNLEHPTTAIRLLDLPAEHEERCRRLAGQRGWMLLGEGDSSPPTVILCRYGGPEEGVLEDSALKRGPRTPQVWLLEPDSRSPSLLPTDLIQLLPVQADDSIWISLIENSSQVGRILDRFYERINHLQQVSTTDALTGLYNRMHLLRVLSNEYKRYQRTGASMSCIMVDLDHFKNINDTYGHSFGDQILCSFSKLLGDSIRESDIVGRYGGEEFLCVLPNTDLDGACAVAEKLRRSVEARVFTEGFFNIELTASFGVSCTSPQVTSDAGLIQLADRALYRAKQTGRNRVCIADGARSQTGQSISVAGTASPDKPTLLIAHKNPESLRFYRSLIEKQQFNLVTVETSDDALKWLSMHTPTAALFKTNLQPLNGWDLIDRVRSKISDQYFPIAILESENGSAESLAGERTGADDVFSEGIGESEFHRRIQVFFRLKLLHDRFNETYERLTGARARLVKAERLSTLGQMASGVAHDFNNVLSTIIGRTERLIRTQGHERFAGELRLIHQAAAEGAKSVRRIQEFSRSLSDLDATPVSISEVVEDCIDLTRVRWKDEAEKDGIRIKVTNRVNPELQTSANPQELREVFVKLFTNAFDAMPEGGELRIRSREVKDEDHFVIEVEDTGIGMERSVQRKVFEPFFTTKREGGTGLGLSIIYGILTRLGGTIEVDSRPGLGTTFQLTFVKARPMEEHLDTASAATAVEVELQAGISPLRILVVEDEASVRELFVDVLNEEGYAVDDAECARDAMTLLQRKRFDVVLTDLGMPDLPGWDVARVAKQVCPETQVILTSGWGDDYTEDHLRTRGVDRWLPKPVSLDELSGVLRACKPVPDADSESMA